MDTSIGNFLRIFPIYFATISYAKTDYLFISAEIEIRAFAMLRKSLSYKPRSQVTGFMNDQDISIDVCLWRQPGPDLKPRSDSGSF